MMKLNCRHLLALAIATTLPGAVNAQELVLEEVVVTSQKRVQSLQDVPISVSALSGDRLNDASIEKIDDLVGFVPNIHMTESGLSTQLRIRGIGSDNNQGFEQSVGLYVDGIYYGRQQLIRAPFLDLERVEVLRGPQSILFGKNSIAGALNMTTAKPTDILEGYVTASYEPEYNQREVTAVISGPISDNVEARLAYRSFEDDGYIENTLLDRDEPSRDEDAIRLSLTWNATDDLTMHFKAERDTFDVQGRQVEILSSQPAIAGPFVGLTYSEILSQFLQSPGFEDKQDYKRQVDADEFSNNEVNNFTFTLNYQLGENTLTAVTGWVDYEFQELCDCDFGSGDVFTVGLNEEYDQFSQEIRLTSPLGTTFDWIVGAFYQTSDISYYEPFTVSPDSVLRLLLASEGWLPDTVTQRNFNQTSDVWAIFAQTTWNISDQLRLTLGARYTQEEKDASRSLELEDGNGNAFPSVACIPGSPEQPCVYSRVFGIDYTQTLGAVHDLSGNRDESAFTPLLNMQYDVNEDTMLYASFSTGFKAGGFDARANRIASFEFEEETATSYEVGVKTLFADGAADLNVALYYTQYEDLQVSQFDGNLGFNVGNAKESVVQGVEVDGRWALAEGLVMRYAFAYLDFEYTDFSNGNCYAGQVADGDEIGDVSLCDYTGKSGVYTPKKTGNLGFDYTQSITSNLLFRGGMDMQYVDGHDVHPNLDPSQIIDDYTTLNMRLGIESDAWSVALVGKNLTDEDIVTYAADAPLSASSFTAKATYGFVRRPATVAVEGSYRF
jgi:iron complex outermembrane recepter protein